ncbi:winged helix-turn-helix transcriptional regulator [Granulicella tundricola]|uniref:winged helix-turn-helix transcriptional regulator n=1 Tax=Granulicella tundricola TaxID=940615 RepID=UPI000A01C593
MASWRCRDLRRFASSVSEVPQRSPEDRQPVTRRKEEEIPRATWTLSVLYGKWKLKVLVEMRDRPVRISELQRNVAGATKKMLIDTLHALEADGIVERKEFEAAVRHVEYGIMPSLREPTC